MAEILSLHDARHAADRADAFAYLDRMTAFQEEMRRLTDLYGILGDPPAAEVSPKVVEHPTLRRA